MSVPVSGNYDCAKHLEIKAKVTEIWVNESVINKEYVADVEAALAIIEGQTARFEVLTQPEKDREVKVWWVDDCDQEDPVACTDQCVLEGEEIGTSCANYGLTECFEKSFSITEEQFRTSILSKEEVVARALIKKLLLMDQFWAAKGIAHLNASAGVNKYDEVYDVVGNTTYIPAASWNPDLFGYLETAQWFNKLSMSSMLSGTLMRQYWWKVMMEQSDPTGASAFRKLNSFGQPRFDRRMDTILGEKGMFLWDKNSVAMVTKARHLAYGATGRELIADGGKQLRTTIQSPNLPGVTYDLTYQEKCVNDDISHVWKIVSRGDLFLNPLGCDNDRTGVLKLLCGEAP